MIFSRFLFSLFILESLPGLAFEVSIEVDLIQWQTQESQTLSPWQIRQRNEQDLRDLEQAIIHVPPHPQPGKNRVTAVSQQTARKLMESVRLHPVVGDQSYDRYNQPGYDIGFCFGRAFYAHLALLRLGVAKEAIRKVWLVGPMWNEGAFWRFHVATVVKGTDGVWWVIDNVPGSLLSLRDWVDHFMTMNRQEGRMRIYITPAERFSTEPGAYDRRRAGLDLPADQDWYRHYFFDLMKWFQDHSLSEYGLEDLRQSN